MVIYWSWRIEKSESWPFVDLTTREPSEWSGPLLSLFRRPDRLLVAVGLTVGQPNYDLLSLL